MDRRSAASTMAASMAASVALLCGAGAAQAQQGLRPIRISVQPGNYSAIAYKVANQLGYWQELGLAPTFQTYPAGVPQIQAHANWDIGTLGAVPALIGARDFGLITVAVANDESRTNVLMGRKELVARLRTGNSIPNGTRIGVTLNSTGDFATQTCLALWGGKSKSDMVYQGMTQAEIMAAGAAGTVDLVAVWAPNLYTMAEKHGFEVLCSGRDFSPGVFGVTVANRAWAQSNADTLVRALAVVLRANRWIKRNPARAQQIHIEGSAKEGVTISAAAARQDNELRAVYELEEQIDLLRGTVGELDDSRVSRAFFSLNVFLNEGKLQSRRFRPSAFVDVSFLERIKSDAALAQFIQRA
jgi:ABC-type nitrate/sulfonate/bicarbonate transport system substrate-binding protein